MKQDILDVIESELTLAGYQIMDGDNDSLIIRDNKNDCDYEIKITELT